MTEPWTVDNGLITPTFKVRRNEIESRFSARYDSWQGQGSTVIWAQP